MNEGKQTDDPSYLEPMDDVELVLNHYDVADGINTHSGAGAEVKGDQPLTEALLLEDDGLTEAQECARLAFAVRVSRAQRLAAESGERIPLQGFEYNSEEDDLEFAEKQYRLKKAALQAGLAIEGELPGEISPKEQLATEAKKELDERARIYMREIENERSEEELKAEYEEIQRIAKEEADARSTFTDIDGTRVHPNVLNESQLLEEDEELDLEKVNAEEELEKAFEEDEKQPEEVPFEKPEEPKAEAPKDLNNSVLDQADFRTERENTFKEAEKDSMAVTNYSRLKMDIAELKAEGGVLETLAEQADLALGDMLEAYSGDRVFSRGELVNDMASLILVQQLSCTELLKNSFQNSAPKEGYLNADHKMHLDLIRDGSDFQFAVDKVLQSQNTPDFKSQLKGVVLSDPNERTVASPLNSLYEECLVEKNTAMLMGSKAAAKAERAKEREERIAEKNSSLVK